MKNSSDVLEYLQSLLREYPENTYLKQLIVRERRRNEAFGKRGRPPARTVQAARDRLLPSRGEAVALFDAQYERLPIDVDVCKFIDAGHIRVITPEAQAAGEEGITPADALLEARQGVVDGCRWGDYYARFKLGAERSAKANAKIILGDAKITAEAISNFLQNHTSDLSNSYYVPPGLRQSRNKQNFSSEIEALKSANEAVTYIAEHLGPHAEDKGGSPGNPWRVGFVFGISHAWMGLTKRKISGSAGALFVNFTAACGNSLDGIAPRDSDAWSSAIKTASKEFELAADGRSWGRRPGPKSHRMKPTP